jgi:hypothetical protein
VNVRKIFNSLVARSLLVGIVIPFINVISSPRSNPVVGKDHQLLPHLI